LNKRTRIALLNTTNDYITRKRTSRNVVGPGSHYDDLLQEVYRRLLSEVYIQELTQNYYYYECDIAPIIRTTLLEDTYDMVFSLLEFLALNIRYCSLSMQYNVVFKKEFVGYKFIDDKIIKITNEIESNEIASALNGDFHSVNNHIQKALKHLSDRESPDYENSIKESITAVETMCTMVNKKKDTLGAALKKLEKNGVQIHQALKKSFCELYGYTSDANGIRHSGDIGGPNATFEEAKFMLVSCSAFINYLKQVASLNNSF
jgi:hypothetical protein